MQINVDKYRFKDFTLSNYERILKESLIDFTFTSFHEYSDVKGKLIILRHDVEFSVPIALEMAKIEHKLGIKSTYFIQLHGDFYNSIEAKTYDEIKQIRSLGHELGLHFDAHFWGINKESDLDKYLEIDKKTFETYFNYSLKLFSFHNNNTFTLSCKKDIYSGLINVYSFKFSELGYCADSTGFWRYEILEERLKSGNETKLQILIHDGMWQNVVLPPRRRIYKIIDDHASFMKKSYDDTLIKFGAKNIDWEGDINE